MTSPPVWPLPCESPPRNTSEFTVPFRSLFCGRDRVNAWNLQWLRMSDKAMRRRQQRCKPSLEALEDRCLLSTSFTQINLDSDVPGLARVTDPNLVNPWGIAFSPTGAFWFGDNGTSVSDVVDGNGQLLPVVVSVPGANGSAGMPTGTVYNGSTGFRIAANGVSGPAHFLFATEDGTISAWNPQVDNAHAFIMIDNSAQGAEYKGLATAKGTDGKSYLYAADFGRGEIDVFDQNFAQVTTAGSFSDPNLPAGFAPFNVQNINGQLFVTYAKKDTTGDDDAPGPGNGFIDVFSPSGSLVERLASGGSLDSPWGMAVAPQSFGSLGGALLVGNNGDGHINAYNLTSGAYLGQLTDNTGNPLVLDGLWGLTVGNDHLAGNSQTLFFAAGIDWEQHGLFGAIRNSQAGQSVTAGTLPYDPNSDGDDYPLPPARGPVLGNAIGPTTPIPVLVSANNSSFALTPLLSISSDPSESRDIYSLVSNRSSTIPEGTRDSTNPGLAMGIIRWSETLTAFFPASAMPLTASDRPNAKIGSHVHGVDAESSAPISFMFLGHDPSTGLAEPEGSFLLVNVDVSLNRPQGHFQACSQRIFLTEDTPNNNRVRPSMSFAEPAKPAETSNLPSAPFSIDVIRGLCLAVAACLPWGRCRDRQLSSVSGTAQEKIQDIQDR